MSYQTTKYLIYYPATKIGGAQLLMARTAEYLINRQELVGLLIDKESESSFIEQYLDSRKYIYEKIFFSEGEKYEGKYNEILILPQPTVFSLNKVLKKNSKNRIFQWDTHPKGTIIQLSLGKKLLNLNCSVLSILRLIDNNKYLILKNYLEISHKENSLWFMCGKNYSINKNTFQLNYKPNYLPLPINTKNTTNRSLEIGPNQINIAWVGRLDEEKFRLVELVIKDLINFNNEQNYSINFFVIGEGACKSLLKKKYNFNWISYEGVIANEDVATFYQKNDIHIGFNVGTSALEAAINGLYSILLPGLNDIDFYLSKEKRYLELFNSKNYDVSLSRYRYKEALTLKDIIAKFMEGNANNLAASSKDYVFENHNFDNVMEKLYENLQRTNLNYNQLVELNIFHLSIVQKIKKILKNTIKFQSNINN